MKVTVLPVLAVSVLLAALVTVTAVSTATVDGFAPGGGATLGVTTGVAWALAVAAFLLLLLVRGRAALILVLAGSAALGVAALAGPPNLSTDSARYAWDGIVQNHGVSPYAHVPASDALDQYRVPWLFPAPADGADGAEHCTGSRIEQTTSIPSGGTLCTALNRPHVPTIYPPVAEGFFAAVRSVVPDDAEYLPLQVAGLLLSSATTVLLVLGMRKRGLDVRWAAVWGWSPFVAAEAVTNSHVDALGVFLIVAATFAAVPVSVGARDGLSRRRALLVGMGIGLAMATKFVPVIAAPPLARRRPVGVGASAVLTFALTYVPYVAITGWSVLGYLPGYLSEEGYDSGSRFALLSGVLPSAAATVVAAALILAVLIASWWFADPAQPWVAQVVSIGAVLLIASPAYPWYALVLVPFIALSRRWEWLVVPLALSVRTLVPGGVGATLVILAAAVFAGGATVVRWRRRPTRPPATTLEPASLTKETP
ncbi:glycosyltransferase 87 family protein [Leifsonia sp. NCR5]|uniref:glycosyltransferase 87 family protein n=1 Tax=Leifsonia sp. NCR5 TaxID=1978342 RepID=UPI00211A84B0|nr:glycosyltransferase 87 family protein [Leifsonia sp. NCR5]